jgi:hypothetical protein
MACIWRMKEYQSLLLHHDHDHHHHASHSTNAINTACAT